MLKGYRTYIVAAASIVYALSAWATGHIDANGAVQMIEVALAAAGIRAAIPTAPVTPTKA